MPDQVGDCCCLCGQGYRFALGPEGLVLWPRTGAEVYRPEPRVLNELWRINVEGRTRVFRAVAEAAVPALVYASSVGAYSPGPKDRLVVREVLTGGGRRAGM